MGAEAVPPGVTKIGRGVMVVDPQPRASMLNDGRPAS